MLFLLLFILFLILFDILAMRYGYTSYQQCFRLPMQTDEQVC